MTPLVQNDSASHQVAEDTDMKTVTEIKGSVGAEAVSLEAQSVDPLDVVRHAALSNPSLSGSAIVSAITRLPVQNYWDRNTETKTRFADLEVLATNPGLTEPLVEMFLTQLIERAGDGWFTWASTADPRRTIITHLISHPSCPAWRVRRAAATLPEIGQRAAARNPKLTPADARLIVTFKKGSERLRSEAVSELFSNPNIEHDYLYSLVPDLDTVGLAALAKGFTGDRRAAIIAELLDEQKHDAGLLYAARLTQDPAVLERLNSLEQSLKVRLAIAGNDFISPALLTRLCGDRDPVVRTRAARHPRATDADKTLTALLHGNSTFVRDSK